MEAVKPEWVNLDTQSNLTTISPFISQGTTRPQGSTEMVTRF